MSIKTKVPFLLSLVFLVILWKETQGRCSSCPSNNCTQTEMSQGKCFRARYYNTTHLVSYYTTVYYQETSQGSYKTKCGFLGWRRCTRYRIVYHQRSRRVQKYIIAERENLACDAYCCLQDEVLHEENCYSDGNVQLVGGTTTREGRVEIWYNSQWNTICDDLWDINDAHVVCRQLGYEGAVTAHRSAHFGQGSGQILLDDLQCTGREGSLLECNHNGINEHNCRHGEDASVTCSTSSFTSGTVRLTNGYAPSVGRVEIWYSEQWNTVCDDSWSITDARVVCRQLGYQGAALAHPNAYFGEGSGGILLDNLDCTGAETSLLQCRHNGLYSHNCDHDEDASVTCYCGDPGTPVNGRRSISGYTEGHTVTYTCKEGYELSGSATRTCQSNGLWSGSSATCPPEDCGTPRSLSNGRIHYSGTTVGYTVTYTCNTGYVMTAGSSSRACPSNGVWSGSHPTCTRYCGDPGTLVNGMRSISGYTEGHTVTYTCNEGYELAGSATRTCQSNGLWSGSSATCPISCGTPSYLSNGQRRYSRTVVGSTVTYTCNTGYRMTAGSSSRTCQSNGHWSWTHPTCTPVNCGTPSSLSNGQRRYSSTTFGYTVTYTCNTGYLRTAGSSSRTCQSNGQWSGTHPTCTRSCGTPRYLSNAQRRYSSTTVGYTVTYTCNTGYLRTAGSSTRTCQPNGQWSGTHPTCTLLCGTPSYLSNGQRRYSSTIVGSRVSYTCNTGYLRTAGSSSRTCQSNGQWSGSHPTCTLDCGTPRSLSNGQRRYSNTTVGSTVTYTCNTGYLRTAGSSSRTCQSSGQWSGSHPTCEGLKPPSQVTNVSLTRYLRRGRPSLIVRWTAPQSDAPINRYKIQYKRTGSVFWGSEAATVGSPPPTKVTLISLAVGTNYTVRVSATSSNGRGEWSEEQTERTYKCPSKVTNVSLAVFEATSLNVTWAIPQSDMPITQYQVQYRTDEVPSWNSTPPLSGSPPPSSTVLNGMHSGYDYILRVRAMSVVGAGEWSEEQTQRIGNVCSKPEGPANGGVASTGNIEGDTASYFCNSGFTLFGDRIRTCQSDGQWSGTQPQCNRTCDEPQSPANGGKNSTGNTEGQMVNYFCNPGFKLSGDKNRTCQSDGQWSGSQPLCIDINCDEPQSPANGGKVTTGSGSSVGDTVSYFCNPGFKLSGDRYRICQPDGQWSGSQPNCSRYCDPPVAPSNGDKIYSGNLEGDTVTYFCNKRYRLYGDVNRTCQSNGEWSGIQPRCDEILDGGWSHWVNGTCSITCGGEGVRVDTRTCDNPPPQNGGKDCYGSPNRTGPCFTCPCEGGWSSWSSEPCSRTCGGGTRNRSRNCTTPNHLDCCPGNNTDVETCGEISCPIDGGWSPWIKASNCSVLCGGGVQLFVRKCNNPVPANGGKDCEGPKSKNETCAYCPCEGGWSPWSPGPCSHTCGNGTRTSTRNCTTPDHPDCCPGNSTMVETCVEDSCPGWIKVTNCSVECGGGGIQVFVRDCPAFASGGKLCEVPTHKIEYCGYCPCDGGWSPWSRGPCSHTCGNGTRTSTRNCTTPDHPDCCPGNSTIVETCSEGSCPSCSSCNWTVAWPCSKTCGGKGMQVLVRECNGGKPCEGPSHKVEPCGYCPCDGGWSPWSRGPCSHTCGNGTRTSTRNCTTPDHPDCCPGNSTMVEECSEGSCAVDGNWSDWREVLPCNKPCGGGGARVLMRECNNPEPANGGNDCVGEELKIDHTCADCPCEGGWSPWSRGPCSHNCGKGIRTSTRNCTTPDHPDCCPGDSTIIEACEERKCSAVDGGWSSWQEAIACTATCGGGTRYLTRRCNNPTPANGGRDCEGETIKADICAECPCDAHWSSWTQGICSGPCGQNGTAVATRKCNGPSQCCRGKRTRTETCTSRPC